MVNENQRRLRRREIADSDLEGVIDLLRRGFPDRRRAYWERGLRRMGDRPTIEACPRYGFMFDDGQRPVGAVLTLYDAERAWSGESIIRCNLSSWTVDPVYRMQAPQLVASALKRRDVTYINVSPASHTWATIEAQGFRPYADGQVVVAAALGRAGEPARVRRDPAARRDLPEAPLLEDHVRYGCTCLVVEASDGPHPFLVLPFRARSGRIPLPFVQLIYSRDIATFWRFSGTLGRALLARGALAVVLDADPPPGGPPVLRRLARGRKYFKGPHPPRLGDLTYTERVLFGP